MSARTPPGATAGTASGIAAAYPYPAMVSRVSGDRYFFSRPLGQQSCSNSSPICPNHGTQ
jgi:hypothetical protein